MTKRPKIIASLALLGAVLVPASPAEATVTVEDATHTLFDSCRDYAVQVSGSMPGAVGWSIDVDLYAPSGDWSSGHFDYGDGSAFNSDMLFSVCASEGVGVYTLDGTVTWDDADYNSTTERVDGTVNFVRQATRSAIAVSDATPRVDTRVTVRMRSQQETPSGWAANASEYVALEIRCGKEPWTRVRGSKSLTSVYGRASLSYRWDTRRTCKLRTVTLSTVNSAVSRSLPVTVNPS